MDSCLEEKITCLKVLLDLTQEQVRITKEKHIDLKRLDLILQQKEDQQNKIKRIDHFLRGLDGSQVTKEKTATMAQILKDLVALEEVSYQSLFHRQLALREELINYQRKRGLSKLYINRLGRTACPKLMERKI